MANDRERRSPEQHTEVIEERPPTAPPRPPPWWQGGWWLLGLFGLAVLGGVLALVYFGGDDDDGESVSPGPTTTLTTTTEVSEPTGTDTTESETTTEAATTTSEQVSVPDAVGQDHVEAGAAVDSVGLVAHTVPVPSTEARGTVVAQSPAPNTQLDAGSAVQLNVSLGPSSRPRGEIPDVTGPEAADALARCREANFTCVTRDAAAPSSEEVGEVVDQRPAAGTSAEVLTQITLFVGR